MIKKHSKFSASGAERWFSCPGSVALSEGLPDKDSPYAAEGTLAHEVHERLLKSEFAGNDLKSAREFAKWRVENNISNEMFAYVAKSAYFISGLASELGLEPDDCLVETKVSLAFIDPAAFGTLDAALVDYFGTLHIFDFKYGVGHAVSPDKNLQMIFYALGIAHLHHWNFQKVRLWINQPRVRGFDGPVYWEISIAELRAWVKAFKKAIGVVRAEPEHYTEGEWCHWCKAKSICPLKKEKKLEEARGLFTPVN